jgi:cation-transporting ATPase 13A1
VIWCLLDFWCFHCPLKEDAIETLKMLADSSHRVCHLYDWLLWLIEVTAQCIMITGDNPLTAVHVARDVEIVDREALILDLKENPAHEGGVNLCSPLL